MRAYSRIALVIALALPALAAAQGPQSVARTVRLAVPSRMDVATDTAAAQLEDFLTRYPDSPLRPNALFELGELLVRTADEQFAVSQRAGGDSARRSEGPIRPNYAPAITRYEELVRRYPNFDRYDAAAYTLGTLYSFGQRYADAARMFDIVAGRDSSRFRNEALFRLGDARFELASQARGDPRRQLFARAAEAYERATASAPPTGDIYFLSLYKLGWAYYNQATQTNQQAYRRAVDTFGKLVEDYDKLTAEQQRRLGLRQEAIEYMAVAFTQVGGSAAADAFFAQHGGSGIKLPVLKRVASSLRDQGDFPQAVAAYRTLLTEAPTDTGALAAQREIIDIYQNRLLDADSAQAARLALVENFGPSSSWARANPTLADTALHARELALRQSAQFALARAQKGGNRQQFAGASALYDRYFTEFATSDSAQVVAAQYGEALFGGGDYFRAGSAYSRAAYGFSGKGARADTAGRNAIVAFDSALVHNRTDAATQDSLFASVDRYAAAFPQSEVAKRALVLKGRRASETKRWDVLASTFRAYAAAYPNDPYTPTAEKLVGDALYQQGQYAEAQVQWEKAQGVAQAAGRRALVDSIAVLRTQAAASFADTLVKQGKFQRAAEEVYVAFADKNPRSERAPGALRDAIETYVLADSTARRNNDQAAARQARQRAIELSNRLVTDYPNYQYRLTYQTLAARFLLENGNREEAVAAYRKLIAENPRWPGRADAMVRVAANLDSLKKGSEAARAYEDFAAAYPRDPRARDALRNAAETYQQAGDNVGAARVLGTFASRYPGDSLAVRARQQRITLLQTAGDSAGANAELGRLCSGNASGDLRGVCASRVGESYFKRGVGLFGEYQRERLVIATKAQLTKAGVRKASARKERLLTAMTSEFRRAIESGSPQYLAAATYYVGLSQWEYGSFLKNAKLPASLTDAERTAAEQGAAGQAEEYYAAARKTWQALIDKAAQDTALREDKGAAPWIERAREGVAGKVPETPPTASAGAWLMVRNRLRVA
ncbi:MAG: hypothetical protein NVS9B3_06950 [Gemmatimonadaceae bacterium]